MAERSDAVVKFTAMYHDIPATVSEQVTSTVVRNMYSHGERSACLVVRWIFFSSRRRHTRFDCDWSSDVCSSDLSRHVTFVLVANWLLYPKYVLLSNGKTRMKPAVNIPQQLFGVPVLLVVKAQTLVIGTSISWRNGAHESG